MNTNQIFSILRTILIAIGGFFIGRYFLGEQIDGNWINLAVGGVLAIVSGIFSWINKELDVEKKISLIRNSVTFIGGFLVTAGLVSEQLLMQVLGIITSILSLILGNYLKSLNKGLSSGKTDINKLNVWKK